MTNCSTSSRLTPWPVSAAHTAEDTPGLAGPVTVTNNVDSVASTDRSSCPGGTARVESPARSPRRFSGCPHRQRERTAPPPLCSVGAPPGHLGTAEAVTASLVRRLRGGEVLLVLLAAVGRADVGLCAHPLRHVRVVQLEGRTLGADPGQLGEVVPRRRAAGRPLERVAVAPRVVDRDDLAVAVALEHVPDERQRRGTEDEGEDRRD